MIYIIGCIILFSLYLEILNIWGSNKELRYLNLKLRLENRELKQERKELNRGLNEFSEN